MLSRVLDVVCFQHDMAAVHGPIEVLGPKRQLYPRRCPLDLLPFQLLYWNVSATAKSGSRRRQVYPEAVVLQNFSSR